MYVTVVYVNVNVPLYVSDKSLSMCNCCLLTVNCDILQFKLFRTHSINHLNLKMKRIRRYSRAQITIWGEILFWNVRKRKCEMIKTRGEHYFCRWELEKSLTYLSKNHSAKDRQTSDEKVFNFLQALYLYA